MTTRSTIYAPSTIGELTEYLLQFPADTQIIAALHDDPQSKGNENGTIIVPTRNILLSLVEDSEVTRIHLDLVSQNSL